MLPLPRRLHTQMAAYLVVATAAAVVDGSVLWGLVRAGVHYTLAAGAGFCVGLVVNFSLARTFVFGRSKLPPVGEFAAYAAIAVVGLALTEAVMIAFIELLHQHVLVSKSFALAIVFVVNFFARRALMTGRVT